ncbi:hypothetical protein K501DRAFT_244889 [Backusella circina FSU 941]|nr:hypothetical protein K501DRAFT_244889 [Backusella circina FSU 941]
MEEVDLRTLRYVDTINDNLVCCICRTPFIDPVVSNCGHTFCKDCIHQALENSCVCPIDRSTLAVNDFQTAVKIIHNMVNELMVYCPRQGCPYTGQRQYIGSHVTSDCEYTIAPCELEECKELLLKKDLNTHAATCKYRTAECNMCKKKLRIFELEDHYSVCPSETIDCPHCGTSTSRSEHNKHLISCPDYEIHCPYYEFGCNWLDRRQKLPEHLDMMCAYEPIKEYLELQKENEASLKKELKRVYKENEGLRRQQLDSKHQVEFITNQLDLMFPGHFITDPDIPEEARNESLLSENQRINNELETLTANLKSLELKQNMALMSETFRLQEELQSLRAICHGMRMQMHYLMMERRGATNPPGSNNASNPGGSENNPNGGANSLDRMRTWLDMTGGPRQETKL